MTEKIIEKMTATESLIVWYRLGSALCVDYPELSQEEILSVIVDVVYKTNPALEDTVIDSPLNFIVETVNKGFKLREREDVVPNFCTQDYGDYGEDYILGLDSDLEGQEVLIPLINYIECDALSEGAAQPALVKIEKVRRANFQHTLIVRAAEPIRQTEDFTFKKGKKLYLYFNGNHQCFKYFEDSQEYREFWEGVV